MSDSAPQKRRWQPFLKRLWRRPTSSPDADPTKVIAQTGDNLGIPLPAQNPDRLSQLAGRYFHYAEDLALRGAPELAAPFYRQSYALLLASVQPKAKQQVKQPAPPAWQEQLQRWRQELNRDTAASISHKLDELIRAGAQSPELHNLQGLAALQLRNPEAAQRSFRSGLQLNPDHYSCLVNLSGLELQAGRSQQAIDLLQQALRQSSAKDVEAVPALNNLALAHQQQGKAMEAALLVHKIHRLKPGYLRPSRVEEAAQTLEQMGEEKLAIELLQWLQHNQPNQSTLRQLALLLEQQGDFEAATQAYQKSLAHQPQKRPIEMSTEPVEAQTPPMN